MDKLEFEYLFSEIRLTTDVRLRLERVCGQPEGDVEARWVHKLITYYLYSPQQIALQIAAGAGRNAAKNTVFADIVAYRDKKRKEPFVVIEVKKPKSNNFQGIKQAESY